MQFKIILFLLAFIFAIIGVFGLKEIKELKRDKKALETQINAVSRQNEKNIEDLQIRNKEIEEINAKKDILQKQINKIRQSNSDKCFNSLLSDDVMQLLQSNGIK